MSYTVGYPVNFTPNGDTTSQAIGKFINEFSRLYGYLNAEAARIVENPLVSLESDPAPKLGANLDLNGKSLVGDATFTGKVSLAGIAQGLSLGANIPYSAMQVVSGNTVDWTKGAYAYKGLSANWVPDFASPPESCILHLFVQNGASAYTVTWPSSVMWPQGVVPTMSSTAYDLHLFQFLRWGNKYYGTLSAVYTGFVGMCV